MTTAATPISKRIRELEKELSKVDDNIRNLSRSMGKSATADKPATAGKPNYSPGAIKLPPLVDPLVDDRPPVLSTSQAPVRPPRDDRFRDYLSTSLERPSVPLRYERSVQRNKAIVTLCLVVVVLFWILHHVLL